MNSETKFIKSRLGLLKLAEHLNNVTKASGKGFAGTTANARRKKEINNRTRKKPSPNRIKKWPTCNSNWMN